MKSIRGATPTTGKTDTKSTKATAKPRTSPFDDHTRPMLSEMAKVNFGKAQFMTAIDKHLTEKEQSFRPYQVEALAAFSRTKAATILPKSKKLSGGRQAKSALLISPTGSGKTTIFTAEVLDLVRQGEKVLVLGHRDYLLGQIQQRLEASCPEASKALIKNQIQLCQGTKELNAALPNKAITITSTQTLSANRDELPEFFKKFDTIVIDEAHHYTAPDYLATIETIIAGLPAKKEIKIIGATATPLRHTPGAVPMSHLFPLDNVIWTRTMRQLITDGFLKTPNGIRINTNLGEGLSVDVETQNVNSEDIKLLTRNPEFNNKLFDAYEEQSKGKNVIFYSHDLKHSELLFQEALRRKLSVVMIDGEKVTYMKKGAKGQEFERIEETGTAARKRALDKFGSEYKAIINCKVLTEALDLPQTQAIVYGSVTRSIPELQQIVGRGMRIDPNHPKERSFDFIYLDPQTRNKINFANLAQLGLEQFEKVDDSKGTGTDFGGRAAIPMEDPLEVKGLALEGSLIDHPDPEWEKVLKVALKQKFPELKIEEAITRVTERMALSNIGSINYRDIAVGNDILFGSHGFTKIREAQRIFRELVQFLGLNLQVIQTRFPRLTGFDTYDEIKPFLCSILAHRPDNLHEALGIFNQRFGIDATYLHQLAKTSAKLGDVEISTIFDDIWDKQDWSKYYHTVAAHLRVTPADITLSRKSLMQEFNQILETHKAEVTIEMKDLDSIRDFKAFILKHDLEKTLKHTCRAIEETFIPRLEKAIWLDQCRLDLETNNCNEERTSQLAKIGIIKAKPLDHSKAELRKKIEALLELEQYGNFNDYSSLVKRLRAFLKTLGLKPAEINDLNLPHKLETTEAIQLLLERTLKAHPKLREKSTELNQKLVEHLDLVKWFIRLEASPPSGRRALDEKIRDFIVLGTSK